MIYDRPVRKWKVWTAGGRAVVNKWGSIRAPVVAVLVCYERPYSRVIYGADYIAKDGDSWGQSNDRSELSGAVKEGKLLGPEEWERIRLRVHEEAGRWRRPTR